MTLSTFKERYRNNIKSFTHQKYLNETELSKHIWPFKTKQNRLRHKLAMLKNYFVHKRIKRCNLCLEQKSKYLLNKRSEIVSACPHKNRFQVNNLNKERNSRLPRFLPEHKNSSHVFEIHLKIHLG